MAVPPGEASEDIVPREAHDAFDQELGRFVGTIFGSVSIEIDQMLGERVRWWRFKQSVRIAKKAKKLVEDAGLTAHEIPLRTSQPIFDAASLEDDEDLVARWAALLANAAADVMDVPASFPYVLRELEPSAARLLDELHDYYLNLAPDLRSQFAVDFGDKSDFFDFEHQVDNLIRLGLVRSFAPDMHEYYERLEPTSFGQRFVRACRPPGRPDPPIIYTDAEALRRQIKKRKHGRGGHSYTVS